MLQPNQIRLDGAAPQARRSASGGFVTEALLQPRPEHSLEYLPPLGRDCDGALAVDAAFPAVGQAVGANRRAEGTATLRVTEPTAIPACPAKRWLLLGDKPTISAVDAPNTPRPA